MERIIGFNNHPYLQKDVFNKTTQNIWIVAIILKEIGKKTKKKGKSLQPNHIYVAAVLYLLQLFLQFSQGGLQTPLLR